jgi:hypothetical protein
VGGSIACPKRVAMRDDLDTCVMLVRTDGSNSFPAILRRHMDTTKHLWKPDSPKKGGSAKKKRSRNGSTNGQRGVIAPVRIPNPNSPKNVRRDLFSKSSPHTRNVRFMRALRFGNQSFAGRPTFRMLNNDEFSLMENEPRNLSWRLNRVDPCSTTGTPMFRNGGSQCGVLVSRNGMRRPVFVV